MSNDRQRPEAEVAVRYLGVIHQMLEVDAEAQAVLHDHG
jgi:hypothetical protein